ncbi:type II toxin-antitoxin system ParD family antitoxin [Pseudoprimorskyibacter insulae]|uniref:Antitoxin ParD4 n=1 Tax=Pseudoprimorskyibacter insulae TaxID=1695997 RepID=A0A2R8AXD2_9RHOB|nr:type II toxin-antitoxin system ParD family antitoxin [Pseudoprimorskyibacter insulae]SPF80660.1 Antitoxin ParD4 [Pseudoprimorskyibacter insulae]
MASMNISLPEPMKDWVETQTSSGRYDNASEYVRDLIRHDQDRASKISAMQKLVDEALSSGVSDKNLDDIWTMAKERAQTNGGN